MTTYTDIEASRDDAQPVEAYLFEGTFRQYRYTSGDVDITVAGLVYEAVPIKRSTIKAGTQEEDSLDLELTMPYDLAMVQDYAFSTAPPSLELTVYRMHRDTSFATPTVYWRGPVTGVNVTGKEAKVRVPSIFANLLSTDIPSVYYQTPCNHVLYDSRCKISREANTVNTVAVQINNLLILYESGGTFTDGEFIAGELITEFGERRTIVAHNGATKVVKVNFPFAKVVPGMSISITRGCDHSFKMCVERFNNFRNFGGFPYIPSVNPFEEGL